MDRRFVSLAIVALMVLAISSVFAADTSKVTLKAENMTLADAVTDLSKQAGIQIMCDTGVKGTVNGSFSDMDLEALLDVITKSNNLKWQKLFFPANAEKKPTLSEIKAQAKAVAAASDMPLVVYDPITKKQSVFVRQTVDAPVVSPEKLGLKPLYLISSTVVETAADTKTEGDAYSKFQQLQQERQKALMDMTPEQRVAALQQEMLAQMGMDPNVRAQMMKDQMMARRNMDPNMQQQYRQMMHDTFQMLRDQGVIPDHGWGGDHGPRGNGGNHNRGGQQPNQ